MVGRGKVREPSSVVPEIGRWIQAGVSVLSTFVAVKLSSVLFFLSLRFGEYSVVFSTSTYWGGVVLLWPVLDSGSKSINGKAVLFVFISYCSIVY